MQLALYDKCELRDGRFGWIIEVLGSGEAYMIELDKKGMEDRVITVRRDEIAKKVV